MILGWRRPGKVDQCRHRYSSLAQSVEHSAVNRVVARSSRAGGAKNEERYSTEIAFLMEVRLSFGWVSLFYFSHTAIKLSCSYYKVQGLGFSGYHEMWKHWDRVLFCFPENQVIENLSAICESFLTASVAGRETTPPRAIKAAESDLWASCGRYIEGRSHLLSME